MRFIHKYSTILKIRKVSPDYRCIHARSSFCCVCGLRIRRDAVIDGTLVRCSGCFTLFRYIIESNGRIHVVEVREGAER